MNFSLVIYYIDILIWMCNTQKHHFNNLIYFFTEILTREVTITSYSFKSWRRTKPESTFIPRVRMAESGSPQHSFDSENEYDLTLSSLLSSEVSEEVHLSWLSLEMEVLPYRFEPDLPGTDINDRADPPYCFTWNGSSVRWLCMKYRLVSLFMNAIWRLLLDMTDGIGVSVVAVGYVYVEGVRLLPRHWRNRKFNKRLSYWNASILH